jgi:hypothetical protein
VRPACSPFGCVQSLALEDVTLRLVDPGGHVGLRRDTLRLAAAARAISLRNSAEVGTHLRSCRAADFSHIAASQFVHGEYSEPGRRVGP